MKILIFFLMLSMNAFAQIDTISIYKYSVHIESIDKQEFNEMSNLLTDCSLFGFSFYCSKEEVFIIEAYLDLTKLEFFQLLETVVSTNRINIIPLDVDEEFHCSMSSFNNIIIKD